MARFISLLSGGVPSELVSTFDVRSISDGTTKRTGLINSRSAVSTDIYQELDVAYQIGTAGTYFPPDQLITITNGVLTGSVYTASLTNPSVAGIRTPADYRTRPTASILSSQTTLVGVTTPQDSASVTYTVYLNASNAVRTVLNSITGGGPYGRLGLTPSRTLHSIWHDPNLGYFAWDDFTPGIATLGTPLLGPYTEFTADNVMFLTSSTTGTSASIQWTTEYLADSLGQTDLTVRLSRASNNVLLTTANLTVANGTGVAWTLTPAGLAAATGDTPVEVHFTGSTVTFDSTITTNQGASSTYTFANLPVKVWRLVTYNTRLYALQEDEVTISGPNALLGACKTVTIPIYASFTEGNSVTSDPNPSGTNIGISKKVFSSIVVPATPFEANIPSAGAPYYLVQSTGAQPATGDRICKFNSGIQPPTPICYDVFGTCTTISNL